MMIEHCLLPPSLPASPRHDATNQNHKIVSRRPGDFPTVIYNGGNAGEHDTCGWCKSTDSRSAANCHSYYPQFMMVRDFTHKLPVEILLKILQLVAPPRTRKGMHILSKLTHICQFWRAALIN